MSLLIYTPGIMLILECCAAGELSFNHPTLWRALYFVKWYPNWSIYELEIHGDWVTSFEAWVSWVYTGFTICNKCVSILDNKISV